MSVAFGDCAPLVGHNAFLRWSAVKKVRARAGCQAGLLPQSKPRTRAAAPRSQVGYVDAHCRPGETKYWSEASVSEDFDLYIRLASANMFGRYVMCGARCDRRASEQA